MKTTGGIEMLQTQEILEGGREGGRERESEGGSEGREGGREGGRERVREGVKGGSEGKEEGERGNRAHLIPDVTIIERVNLLILAWLIKPKPL